MEVQSRSREDLTSQSDERIIEIDFHSGNKYDQLFKESLIESFSPASIKRQIQEGNNLMFFGDSFFSPAGQIVKLEELKKCFDSKYFQGSDSEDKNGELKAFLTNLRHDLKPESPDTPSATPRPSRSNGPDPVAVATPLQVTQASTASR